MCAPHDCWYAVDPSQMERLHPPAEQQPTWSRIGPTLLLSNGGLNVTWSSADISQQHTTTPAHAIGTPSHWHTKHMNNDRLLHSSHETVGRTASHTRFTSSSQQPARVLMPAPVSRLTGSAAVAAAAASASLAGSCCLTYPSQVVTAGVVAQQGQWCCCCQLPAQPKDCYTTLPLLLHKQTIRDAACILFLY